MLFKRGLATTERELQLVYTRVAGCNTWNQQNSNIQATKAGFHPVAASTSSISSFVRSARRAISPNNSKLASCTSRPPLFAPHWLRRAFPKGSLLCGWSTRSLRPRPRTGSCPQSSAMIISLPRALSLCPRPSNPSRVRPPLPRRGTISPRDSAGVRTLQYCWGTGCLYKFFER